MPGQVKDAARKFLSAYKTHYHPIAAHSCTPVTENPTLSRTTDGYFALYELKSKRILRFTLLSYVLQRLEIVGKCFPGRSSWTVRIVQR
jgi:hypothetical protein